MKCIEGHIHDFVSLPIEETAPTVEQMEAAEVETWNDSEDTTKIISSLTNRKFVVVCKYCGMVPRRDNSTDEDRTPPPDCTIELTKKKS